MSEKHLVYHTCCEQKILAVLNEHEQAERIFVYRDKELNLNDIVQGQIVSFHPTLKGYFIETEKKKSVFVPSKEKIAIGTTVFVRILKEARRQKDATGEFLLQKEDTPSFVEQIKNDYPIQETEISSLAEIIDEALEQKISFLNGAEITIEKTEALWSIDVDTKSSLDSSNTINQAAIQLIYQQIQLKNMSGMILIDFAGYKSKQEKETLIKRIKYAFKNDNRTKIYSFSALNLLEIKRKSTSADLYDLFCTESGDKNPYYVSYLIERAIKKSRYGKPTLVLHPIQEKYLPLGIKEQVFIETNLNIKPDYFELKDN